MRLNELALHLNRVITAGSAGPTQPARRLPRLYNLLLCASSSYAARGRDDQCCFIRSPPSISRKKSLAEATKVSSWPVAQGKLFSSSSRREGWWKSFATLRDLPEGDVLPASLESIAQSLKEGKVKNALVVTGAGVSCAAGIPDFRSPQTGLYDNLRQYDLPYPEAVFDISFYRGKPEPFVCLAKEIWPGVKYKPTLSHAFLSLLEKKGCLLRSYTQNIDGLDVVAGVSPGKMVECHGHFRSSSCIQCGAPFDGELCKTSILEKGVAPICPECGGLVKPSIVFFGEELPMRYIELIDGDIEKCELLIVMGTSLLVAPVAYIPELVGRHVPRLLINNEIVGDFGTSKTMDVIEKGDCDEGVRKLCQLAGWESELDDIYRECQNR